MPNPSVVIRKNAAAVVAHGIAPAFQKSYFITELYKRADEIRREGEPLVSARARAMTDEVGGLLWKASQRASGPEVESAEPQEEKPKAFHEFGASHAKVETLARTHQLKHPSKSIEQCRAGVMAARPDLVDGMKREHFAAISGDGAATKTRKAADDEEEISGDAVQDFVAPPPNNGPAHAAMLALADAHRAENPDLSPGEAFSNVYNDPDNEELKNRVIAEHVSPRLAGDAEDHAREQGAVDKLASAMSASARVEKIINGAIAKVRARRAA